MINGLHHTSFTVSNMERSIAFYRDILGMKVVWGYAGEKGAIKNDASAMNMAKEMVHQMHALFQANLKYPEEFDMPLHRLVREKYGA